MNTKTTARDAAEEQWPDTPEAIADMEAILKRQSAMAECVKYQEAIEQLARHNPVGTLEWLRSAFKNPPAIYPSTWD